MSDQCSLHNLTAKISKQNSVIFIKWSDILGKNAIFTKESVIFIQNSGEKCSVIFIDLSIPL